MKVKKHLIALLSFICFIVILIANETAILKQIGKLLVYENYQINENRAFPLAVILGGGEGNRIKKGLELYQNKQVKELLITGNKERYRFNGNPQKEYANYLNIPEKDLSLAYTSTSTFTDAQLTLSFIKNKPVKDLLIITSPLHTRRAYSIYKKVFKGHDIKLHIIIADKESESNYESRASILIELQKTLFYWIYY